MGHSVIGGMQPNSSAGGGGGVNMSGLRAFKVQLNLEFLANPGGDFALLRVAHCLNCPALYGICPLDSWSTRYNREEVFKEIRF